MCAICCSWRVHVFYVCIRDYTSMLPRWTFSGLGFLGIRTWCYATMFFSCWDRQAVDATHRDEDLDIQCRSRYKDRQKSHQTMINRTEGNVFHSSMFYRLSLTHSQRSLLRVFLPPFVQWFHFKIGRSPSHWMVPIQDGKRKLYNIYMCF